MFCSLQFLLSGLIYFLTHAAANKNVLFIISDDMRPELEPYSGDFAPTPVQPPLHTPNIDKLADDSLLLTRAYVQYPLCAPSRSSLLTGRRPETIQVYKLKDRFRDAGKFKTLPQVFKDSGYLSTGVGKVFHIVKDQMSWSDNFYIPDNNYNDIEDSWAAISAADIAQIPLRDQVVAQEALNRMRELAPAALSGTQHFFLAVGFYKPHLPFVFPEEYLAKYPENVIQFPSTRSVPEDFPHVAWSRCGGLCNKSDVMESCAYNETLPESKILELRRAYYSCISYIDDLVGQLLDELDILGLRNDTIVAFLGDHGWQLGEHNAWCKRTLFEESLRAPVMIRIPGQTDGGIITTELTEFVDIYPTIVEAAGLPPVPLCPKESANVEVCREGTSLMALVENPKRSDWKQRVFSQVKRNGKVSNAQWNNLMGFSIRNLKFRYTEWVKFRKNRNVPDWNSLEASELYDLKLDPEQTVNLANDPAYEKNVRTMSKHLHNGWRDSGIKQPSS